MFGGSPTPLPKGGKARNKSVLYLFTVPEEVQYSDKWLQQTTAMMNRRDLMLAVINSY